MICKQKSTEISLSKLFTPPFPETIFAVNQRGYGNRVMMYANPLLIVQAMYFTFKALYAPFPVTSFAVNQRGYSNRVMMYPSPSLIVQAMYFTFKGQSVYYLLY